MTLRERILAVYRGETPDVVPYMLDLSHWFYHRNRMPWDLSVAYETPERELIDYHRRMGVGFYMPNLASFYSVEHTNGVTAENRRDSEGITWRYRTPLGCIERRRVWEDGSYSWAISGWGVRTEDDLRVLGYALSNRRFEPLWQRYRAWTDYVGDCGVVYMPAGYSAIGQLLNYWMGVEATTYAAVDWPETMRETVELINESNLQLIDLLTESPAEIIVMGDNISADIQPPHFFREWSAPYYTEAVRRLHRAGKYVAVHIDGKLRGALAMVRETGADCSDATTPVPMGDLTPEDCREEAGPSFILSGGVSPDLWLPNASESDFRAAVIRWLELRKMSPRLIANAGDQVPPGAVEERIETMRDLLEEYGRY